MSVNNKQKKEKQMKFNKSVFSLVLVLVLALGFSAFAQQGAGSASLVNKPTLASQVPVVTATATATNRASVVEGKSTFLKSSVQSLGWVGSHEIVLAKSASLYGANLSILLSANADGSLTMLAASGVPGIAGTVIAGGAEAGAAYLFGASIRPDQHGASTTGDGGNVTVNSSNSANGGNAVNSNRNQNSNRNTAVNSNRNSATGGYGFGGQGGNGQGGNGGNGTGGQGGNGGGRTHPNSPGNGGIPGNGGQNGNGHGHNPHANP